MFQIVKGAVVVAAYGIGIVAVLGIVAYQKVSGNRIKPSKNPLGILF